MWEHIDVTFKLKSPLHIGYLPFKASIVSPTRYYVPGRNLWGAITKRVTEYLCNKPQANDYRQIGNQIITNFRFSYYYLYDGKTVYFPIYTEEGLKYGDKGKKITRSEFEHKFIGSIVSTAINTSGTAKDESLHEIEFINNRYTNEENGNFNDVKIAGCIWLKENAKIMDKEISFNNRGIFVENFNIISELILGGESKYGFGHVLLDTINKIDLNFAPFNWKAPEKIKIQVDEPIVSHMKYSKSIFFKGNIELLTGRGYFDPQNPNRASNKPGKIVSKPEYYFSPGTRFSKDIEGNLNWAGIINI